MAKYKWQDGIVCPKCQGSKGCIKKGFKYHCYGISQASMWFFMQKVRKAMECSKKYFLFDSVNTDEFTVGEKKMASKVEVIAVKRKKQL